MAQTSYHSRWKKSFRRLPPEIETALRNLPAGTDRVVGCAKVVSAAEVATGHYAHLYIDQLTDIRNDFESFISDEERAFYDALADNESAVRAMGSQELRVIATELVTQVRKSVTIDWTVRESARARIKVMVKRVLRKHGYPPDLQDQAVKTVLAQAELLCADWAESHTA